MKEVLAKVAAAPYEEGGGGGAFLDARPDHLYRGYSFSEEQLREFLEGGQLAPPGGPYGGASFFSPDPELASTYMGGEGKDYGVLVEIPKASSSDWARTGNSRITLTHSHLTLRDVTRFAVIKREPTSSMWGVHSRPVAFAGRRLEARGAADQAEGGLLGLLLDLLISAGARQLVAFLRESGFTEPDIARFQLSFDIRNPFALEWARQRSAELITQLTEDLRETIRSIIASAFADSRAPRETARIIRDSIGLTTRDAGAVQRLRDTLRAAGADEAFVDRRAQKYGEQLLRKRAERIARTETIRAANEGLLESWREAVRQGFLGPDAKRIWLPSPGACPVCLTGAGQVVGLDEPFVLTTEKGDPLEVMIPPDPHPNCRCGMAIASAEDIAKAHGTRAAYDPDQPRDEDGRWVETGAGAPSLSGRARRLVAAWQSTDRIPAKVRSEMAKLLELTAPGGALAHLRPADGIVLYRGHEHEGSARGGPRSWATDRKTAAGFGSFVDTLVVGPDVLALDLDKVLGEGKSEHEVIAFRRGRGRSAYSPDQPREPAGSEHGGRWVAKGGATFPLLPAGEAKSGDWDYEHQADEDLAAGKITEAEYYGDPNAPNPEEWVLHGTTEEVLDEIRKRGLVAKGRAGGDAWLKKHHPGADALTMEIGSRSKSVFVTMDREEAEYYARIAAKQRGGHPIVLGIRIPRAEFDASVAVDEANLVPQTVGTGYESQVTAFRFRGRIKPEWIIGARRLRAAEEDGVTWWCVLLVDGEEQADA